MTTKFEIRQIDAWGNKNDGFEWNESFHITDFETSAKDEKRAFRNSLAKAGIYFKPHKTEIYDDGEILELQDRYTKEPLFAAIPQY